RKPGFSPGGRPNVAPPYNSTEPSSNPLQGECREIASKQLGISSFPVKQAAFVQERDPTEFVERLLSGEFLQAVAGFSAMRIDRVFREGTYTQHSDCCSLRFLLSCHCPTDVATQYARSRIAG